MKTREANQKEDMEKVQQNLEKVQSKLDFLNKYIDLADIVTTETDAKRVLEFYQKIRSEKEAAEQVEAEKSQGKLREQVTKEVAEKKSLKRSEEEMDNYRRDGYDR